MKRSHYSKSLFLLVALLLAGCGPQAAPATVEPIVPPSGVWIGDVDEPDKTYPIQLIFEDCKKASACGQVDYPSYGCGGSFVFNGQEGDELVFTEKITYGVDQCLSGSTVKAVYGETGSVLRLGWYGPDGESGPTAKLENQVIGNSPQDWIPQVIDGLGRVTTILTTGAWINYPPAVGAGALWIANHDAGEILRVDLKTGELVARITAGRPVPPDSDYRWSTNAVAFGEGAVWAAQAIDQAILMIDPETNTVVAEIPVGVDPYDLVVDGDTLWATAFESDAVVRIDIPSMQVVAVIENVYKPTGIAAGGGAVWVALHRSAKMARIDPESNTVVAEIRVGGTDLSNMARPENVVFAYGYVWVANNRAGSVSRIDPVTNEETMVSFPGRWVQRVAAGGDSIWATAEGTFDDERNFWASFMVVKIDPESLAYQRWMVFDAWSIAHADAVLWLTSGERVIRIELEN